MDPIIAGLLAKAVELGVRELSDYMAGDVSDEAALKRLEARWDKNAGELTDAYNRRKARQEADA